jgi:hypothetical protein
MSVSFLSAAFSAAAVLSNAAATSAALASKSAYCQRLFSVR